MNFVMSFALGLAMLALPGCGNEPNGNSAGELSDRFDPGPPTPPIVYATSWTELVLQANYARTTVDVAGHFLTNRNACGKEDGGALDLGLWNEFATAMNASVAQDELPEKEEYCLPAPEYVIRPSSLIDVSLERSKRTLFHTRADEACTRIRDRDAAKRLLLALDQIIRAADREGCPNGWRPV